MSLQIMKHIVPENWMREKDIAHLFEILQGGVFVEEPQALLVGGCVRNILMAKLVEDIDIATVLPPDIVMQLLQDADIKVIPTGIDHGTVTAVINKKPFEITTLRHDAKTDGRHAEVAFTDSWEEDAKRRDFTINTLLMDLRGNVYDPLEQGLNDIENKVVRFVGTPEKRIKEDYLRILRFFRFPAIYGQDFDADGLNACAKMADGIKNLSKERSTQELFKIIASDAPAKVLDIMFSHNVLSDLNFERYDPEFFTAFCGFQKRYRLGSLSSRLFVFAAMDLENIKTMEKQILFPKVFLKDMQCINGALNLRDLNCDSCVREAVYRFGRVASAQAIMIELVQDRVMNHYAPNALDIIQNWDIPSFPLSGHDLMERGIEKGPELGKTLETLENYWIESDFKPDHNECLDYMENSSQTISSSSFS